MKKRRVNEYGKENENLDDFFSGALKLLGAHNHSDMLRLRAYENEIFPLMNGQVDKLTERINHILSTSEDPMDWTIKDLAFMHAITKIGIYMKKNETIKKDGEADNEQVQSGD